MLSFNTSTAFTTRTENIVERITAKRASVDREAVVKKPASRAAKPKNTRDTGGLPELQHAE